MQSFGDEAKYDVTNAPGATIQADYEAKRTDAWERIEDLGIIKRIISVCMLLSQRRYRRIANKRLGIQPSSSRHLVLSRVGQA